MKRRGRLLNAGARTCLELWWIDASPFVRSLEISCTKVRGIWMSEKSEYVFYIVT